MWRKVVCGCGLMKPRHNIAEAVGIGTGIGRKSPTPLLFVGVGSVESASHPSSSCVKSFYFTKKYSNHGNNKAVAAVAPLFHRSTTSFSTFSTTGDDDNHSNSNSNSNANSNSNSNSKPISNIEKNITCAEAKKLMRLVNVETLKMKLGMDGKEVIDYTELLKACESMGVARSPDEAVAFARVLDDAGVILLFRDKVYLYPDKVVDLVRRAMPLALHPEDDSMRNEFKMLQEKKEEIDVQAHKQVRCILWSGLGLAVIHIGLFFRLTFWEFSWDVMEPIAFFSTTTAVIIGYGYFLLTSRDPTYEDLLKRLFLSRQRKLFKKLNFDVNRFKELQMKCKTPLDASTSIRNRLGLELKLEDSLHRD